MVFKVRTERTQKLALGEAERGNGKSQKGEKWRITDRFTLGCTVHSVISQLWIFLGKDSSGTLGSPSGTWPSETRLKFDQALSKTFGQSLCAAWNFSHIISGT